MTNKKSTKRALLLSVLSLLLCVSMLIGSTFAWFTDSVTSGNNIIKSGNLDVQLFHSSKNVAEEEVTASTTNMFKDVTLWEPGAMVWEKLTVKNNGSLALKYALNLNVLEAAEVNGHSLDEVLKVAVLDAEPTRDSIKNATLMDLASFTAKSERALLPATVDPAQASESFYVAIYWEPTANDNNYNVAGEQLYVNLGVTLVATQYTYEEDSFNSQYDVDANAHSASVTIEAGKAATLVFDEAPSLTTKLTKITIPADAFAAGTVVSMTLSTQNSLSNAQADGQGIVGQLDVTMLVNGAATTADFELPDGKAFTVETYVSKGLVINNNSHVDYTGTTGRDEPALTSYSAADGYLVFTTNHFSNYAVKGEAVIVDIAADTAYPADEVIEVLLDEEKMETAVIPAANVAAVKEIVEAAATAGTLTETQKEAIVEDLSVAEVNGTKYASLAEAFEAAASGDTIVLLKNVAQTASLTVAKGKTLILDLNGKTIIGTDTTAKNYGLINNNGTLTITGDGKMTLVSTINSGWNRYAAVISNNPGGTLVVESGYLENLGGTDMAYGIDSLTNGGIGDVSVTINGGTIKSSYRAIRQFLNSDSKKNDLVINAGTLEGANTGVFFHDPSTKANNGSLVIAENAKVSGAYLFVTAGSAKWPVYVQIAESAMTGEITSKNIPEGYRLINFNGTYTVVSVPVAEVSTLDDLTIEVMNGNEPITLDCGYTFLPNQTELEAKASGYADWHADFVVSVDKSITTGDAGLAGYYSAWCEAIDHKWVALDMSGMELPANEEFRLVAGMGTTVNYGEICKYAIREENITNGGKNGFLCGAYADETMDGVTLNVELRLYEVPAKGECANGGGCNHSSVDCETGNYIVIGTYSHTFGE